MNNQKHTLIERSDRFAGVYPCGFLDVVCVFVNQ
jgi:hypothetical protein